MSKDMGASSGSRASMEPASSLHPTGFDPARIPSLVADMRSVADCDARAGEPLGKALRKGADAIVHLFDTLDRIANETDTVADFDGYFLRDMARKAIWPNYAIAMEAATAGETCNRLDPKDDSAGRRHRPNSGSQVDG
jgi:hypothetical protein